MEGGGAEKAAIPRVAAPVALARGLLVGPQPAASAPKAFPSGVPAATPTAAPRTMIPGNISVAEAKIEKLNISPTTSSPRTPVPSKSGGSTPAASSPAPNANARSHESSPRHQNHQRKPRRTSGDREQGGKGQRRAGGDEQPKQHSDKEDPLRIIVSGYPPYSQPQDLTRVFAKYGNVKLEKINHRYAVIIYTSPDDAKVAVDASKKVNVYGEFLTVVPYSDARYHEMNKRTPKRDFSMSKQKGMIIDPKEIDLSGDFHQQLERILAGVRLTQEDVAALTVLYTDLETAMQLQWPGCTAIPFGSITTGLGVKSSDADCYMHVPPARRQPPPASANYINKAKRVLQQRPDLFAEILSIPRANTPIVKLFHIPTRTNCDLTFKTPLGAQNSKLVAHLLHADPRLIPMAVVVKYWAKVHEFSGTGKLSNYALTLLIIFYLQQPPASLLPAVSWLQRDPVHDVIVDNWNTGFNARDSLPKSTNTSSISELLGGFFEYYSMFNFDEMAVCPYLGAPLRKELFNDLSQLPPQFHRYKTNVLGQLVYPIRSNTPFVVQDPFEQSHNVASAINGRLAAEIRAYFKFAANAYEKEKLSGCERLFETILLQKPKIIRAKCHPEYRVNLFPRIIVTIIDPDWKPIVRDLVFLIFEKMLKIKLGKVEEKVNMDTKKEKEKYMGTVTKAIWKRKQFSRLYSVVDLGFQEKQAKITDEIIKVDKQVVSVQFQLTLTFCHAPRSAVVAIKLGAGDLNAFRDFGKFFISVMQGWFMNLLRPYARPPEQDTAAKIADTIKMLDANLDDALDSDDDSLSLLANTSTAFESVGARPGAVY